MKKIVMLFCFFTFPIMLYPQAGDYDDVYGSDVIEPKFNGGGLDKLYEFINQQFDYSKVTKAGKMLVAFTIDVDGAIKNIKVIQYNDIESATEIIQVLNKAPNWESAKRGGKPISIEMKIPLEFNLKIKPTTVENTQSVKSIPLTNQTVSSSQKVIDSVSETKTDKNKTKSIETKPSYSLGLKKFYQFIAENYRTPDVEGLKGKVIVSFIVDVDGSLTSFMIVEDIGYGTGKEAIRVLKKSPKWIPGTQNGVPIRAIYNLPINILSRY